MFIGINSKRRSVIRQFWTSRDVCDVARFSEMGTFDSNADWTFGAIHDIDIILTFVLEEIKKMLINKVVNQHFFVYNQLIVSFFYFEVSLWVSACWAFNWSFFAFHDVATVATLPCN
mgnify:CR=1 FL=1